ncbi:MAG TPA: thioesterase family protein [Candidatus Nanopelagicaceae bacterium]
MEASQKVEPPLQFHLETYETEIRPDWIDYNEHMNDSAYAIVLSEANEEFLKFANIGSDYRSVTGCALYTVEAHIFYLAEVHQSDALHARTCIVELNEKKIRLKTELIRRDGKLAARGEFLYLHFDQNVSSVKPFPDGVFAFLSTLT